jgi:tetratricopeptide (TPR) repeat protein
VQAHGGYCAPCCPPGRRSGTIVMRSTFFAAGLGALAALLPTLYLVSRSTEDPAAQRRDAVAETAIVAESWPICTSMDFGERPPWAPLDPEFAVGKHALAARDWATAISILTPAALRDDRNADIQNYLGYAYRQLRQFSPAITHYQKALAVNPRHRSAHEHLGEAYLARGHLAKAEEHLAALERICLLPCDEYDDLKRAITEYNKIARR